MYEYYDTSYTSRTVNGIKELYETLHFACNDCKTRRADSKMAVQDTHYPTFVIMRKNFCSDCWMKNMNKNSG